MPASDITRPTTAHARDRSPILQVGRNCWRIEPARRLAFLVDGEACFAAMHAAMLRARHSIHILAWDIDSRVELVRPQSDRVPAALGELFDFLLRRQPDLRVRILDWDYAMLYALEREWLPRQRFARRHHRRLAFRLDASHPFGASHHQKLVLIDDAVAFVGGFDLARSRWDTTAHQPDAARRRDADGTTYPPFHDVHAIVDHDTARALGELFRARWLHASGEALEPASADNDPWPTGLEPDATHLPIGIARTAPAWDEHPPITEVRDLLLDAIRAARKSIFSETQYFTAESIGSALTARLREPHGPEFVSITSRTQCGWLEETTMGVLRARLHASLKQADVHGRYRSWYPHLPGLGDACLNVHSKVFAIDDRLLTFGSANLSNRSMGLDTECNLVIDAGDDPRLRAVVASLRNRLLAEHLDKGENEVAAAIAARGGLVAAVESLRGDARSLRPLHLDIDPALDALISERAIFDAEHPIDPDRLVAHLFPARARRPAVTKMAIGAAALVVLCALVSLWLWTPLHEWIDVDRLVALAERFDSSPLTPFAIFAAFVLGGLIGFPVNVLTAATIILCGPVLGVIYALIGALLSAQALYEIGHSLGHRILRRFAGERLIRLRQRLVERGLLAVVLVRIVPIAPYSLVNLVAGSARIDRRIYALGTLIGMLPGTVLTALFVDRALAAIRDPGPLTYASFALAALLIVGAILLIRRRMARE